MAHRANSRHQKTIEDTRWGGARHTISALTAGSVAQILLTDGLKETVLRIRGEVVCWMDGTQAPPKAVEVGIGALVVQAGSGTTVIQAPLTDPEAPWLFYERFFIGYDELVTDVIDIPVISGVRRVVDSKAMRIVREGREIQLVVENATAPSPGAINLSFGFRMLLGTH